MIELGDLWKIAIIAISEKAEMLQLSNKIENNRLFNCELFVKRDIRGGIMNVMIKRNITEPAPEGYETVTWQDFYNSVTAQPEQIPWITSSGVIVGGITADKVNSIDTIKSSNYRLPFRLAVPNPPTPEVMERMLNVDADTDAKEAGNEP